MRPSGPVRTSLQSRVLTLVGAGVVIALGTLTLLGRSTLLSLEREVRQDQQRLAAGLARELSRAIGDDLRLVAGAAGVSTADLPAALGQTRRHGRLAVAAFTADANGVLLACEPAFECSLVRPDLFIEVSLRAREQGRPCVSDPVTHSDGHLRMAAALPLRPVEGRAAAAVGAIFDPGDRRLTDLLDATDIAPTLHVRLRDGRGTLINQPRATATETSVTRASVSGTPWTVELVDVGPDPAAPVIAFRQQSIWMIPTFAAIAMLLGWGIARSVRAPLVDLTAAAERIARGELSDPIDTDQAAAGGEEIARLAVALERMRGDLEGSIRTIEAANQALEARIADRTRQLASVNARLEERERVRQTLLRQVISAQEDERRRIARELHDETAQTLAALGIGVDVALAACAPGVPEEIATRLRDLRLLVDRMHGELHRMIVNLRPSVLDDLGLPAAIRWFVEHHVTPSGLAVRCEFSGLDGRLPSEVETATFRAVQEALNNVVRHAGAESVLLQGTLADNTLTVEIEDDGVGFDEREVVRTPGSMRGIGLLGIRERMAILGGSAVVDSSPGSGTRVVFSIPVDDVPAAVEKSVHMQDHNPPPSAREART
jgi:signal transduction histidine kinase